MPVDPESDEIHPLLSTQGRGTLRGNAAGSFNLTQLQTKLSMGGRSNYSPSGSPNGSPRRTRGSQVSGESPDERADFFDESLSEEEYDFHIEDLINDESPGMRMAGGYDVPLLRDKYNNHEPVETIISAIVNGCLFGKLCLSSSKEPRTQLYNAITLTDSFVVSLHRNDIIKMIENYKRRILND